MEQTSFFTPRKIIVTAVLAVLAASAPWIIFSSFENLDAKKVMVIQSPVSGDLAVYTEPGVKWQGFGTVTTYPRRDTFGFGTEKDGKIDTSRKIRFNDGGHANLYGSVSWEMPLKPDQIIAIHKTFGSPEAVENAAVAKMIDAAIYLAGPLMSSTESSGERRAELVQYINDQAENGVYVTQVKEKDTVDPVSGVKKAVMVTEIVRDEKGMPKRQQGSILSDFNIKLLPMSITELKYDKIVEDQIAQRQSATTQVQIAQANARKAEQEAITTAKQGEANAAKAKWEQETIKAKVVTEAEQKLRVAELAAKEAEQYKREQILRGEGDSQRRQAMMAADGALDQKLAAWTEANAKYADAISKAQPGAWTPNVIMGNTGTSNGSNAAALIDMFSVKTARDLSLDMTMAGKSATSVPAAKK
jgi:hypothetical protein